MTEHESILSAAGRIRRGEMLDELTTAMRGHHGRRRRRRRLTAAATLVTVPAAVAAIALLSGRAERGHDRIAVIAPAESPEPAIAPLPIDEPHRQRIELVHTEPDILERYAARPVPTAVRIDDGELLTTLAALDRRTGLVRDADGIRLTRDVTDAALAARGSL